MIRCATIYVPKFRSSCEIKPPPLNIMIPHFAYTAMFVQYFDPITLDVSCIQTVFGGERLPPYSGSTEPWWISMRVGQKMKSHTWKSALITFCSHSGWCSRTSFSPLCCSVSFLWRKWNWVICSLLFLFSGVNGINKKKEKTEGGFMLCWWKDERMMMDGWQYRHGHPHTNTLSAQAETHRLCNNQKALETYLSPLIIYNCVPFFFSSSKCISLLLFFLPRLYLAFQGFSAWTACRRSSILLSGSPF